MIKESTLHLKSTEEKIAYLKETTRSIPNYPKPGIIFRDLTTIFQDPVAMEISLELMSACLEPSDEVPFEFNKYVAVEARGFILAGGLSGKLGGGIVMARKSGKLPYLRKSVNYHLEYGEDSLEMHVDAIKPGDKIIVVDDLLATGGTAEAACKLVRELGGKVVKILFLVELPELNGRDRLKDYQVDAILSFEGL